jgi:hypothetical protein
LQTGTASLTNAGTISIGGGVLAYTNAAGGVKMVNLAGGKITGSGTILLGYGNGAGLENYALLNQGTIEAVAGETLTIKPADAFTGGGFENQGTVTIGNGGTLIIGRTSNAWFNAAAVAVTNSGSIFLSGGTFRGSNDAVNVRAGTLVNTSAGVISGTGTIFGYDSIRNAGTVLADGGVFTVIENSYFVNSGTFTTMNANVSIGQTLGGAKTTFTNSGVVAMMNTYAQFEGAVVNSGSWITDPTTNVFQNTMTVTSSGDIQAAAGDVFIFHEHFVNQSTQNTTYNTFNTTAGGSGAAGTKFIFDDQSANGTQAFYTAGLLLTGGFVGTPAPTATGAQTVSSFAAVTGFVDNFAIDRLELGNGSTNSTLMLLDTFGTVSPSDGNTAAIFVNDLWIFGSSTLIISNNVRLYFVNSNNWSSANFTLLGNAELHQLVLEQLNVIPEPTVVFLWLSGLATIYAARRRSARRR